MQCDHGAAHQLQVARRRSGPIVRDASALQTRHGSALQQSSQLDTKAWTVLTADVISVSTSESVDSGSSEVMAVVLPAKVIFTISSSTAQKPRNAVITLNTKKP